MSFIRTDHLRVERFLGICIAWMAITVACLSQGISTTTVQGTVYLANGSPGSGTLQISWPAFTTAASQSVAAGRMTANIGADGFVSVNLTPNLGASPAGLFYTAVYHMSDGTTSTEYWVVPSAAQASIAQVRSQVMPAAQAAQAVSKAYVDQAIQSVAQGNLTSTGGQLTGPLYLTGDPTQSLQAADKHYVDTTFAQAMPLTGGVATGPLTANKLGGTFQVDQFPGSDFGAKLQACISAIDSTYGGTCDARNFTGTLAMAANLTISTANTTVLLPCSTVSTANQIIVTAGTRNVSLRGCTLRGSSAASGTQGGTVLMYSGPATAIQVGDKTYALDTLGFHLENVLINTTASSSSTTQAFAAYRTQELDLQSLYLLGNANQTGITLDGTGNYTGGTFYDNHVSGFQTAINGVGHQVTNPASTDWLNASTFVRLHIDCPTNNGNPVSGTYGVNLLQGDGNSFTSGDVEGCATALHLGPNAQNNTVVGLRNENSTYQVVADPGSSYNSWITGGTMFTGRLVDNGTRNSFLDTFHRSFNALNGDWYGSQQDSTLTNHYRLGIGGGNERGLLDRYQTDYGYRWTMGLSDATGGEQFYQVLDELNNVYRISVGQYNNGQASTNNQTVINSAGTGAVVLNGSNNSGTGGVVFGSGGANETTVATVSNTGNAQFNGTMQVGGTTQSTGTMTVRNNADSEVDYYLWPGLTASQKGSFTYKDFNGNSQWYMVKDAGNNWALNSATGGLDSFKAYQSTNSGDTYINASNSAGVVRVNYEPGAGSAFNIYGGNSSNLYASFSGANSIKLPGLSAASGRNCLQIDSSGYISNTGTACGTGNGSGTVNSGSAGQIANYAANGTAVSGNPATVDGSGNLSTPGGLSATSVNSSVNRSINPMAAPYNAKGDGTTDDTAALTAAHAAGVTMSLPPNTFVVNSGIVDVAGSSSSPAPYASLIGSGKKTLISCSPSTTQEACVRVYNGAKSTIQNLSISCNSNVTYCLEYTSTGAAEDGDLRNVDVSGGQYAIAVSPTSHADISHINMSGVSVRAAAVADIVIGDGVQSNVLDITGSQMVIDTSLGDGVLIRGGGWRCFGCDYDSNAGIDVHITTPSDQPLVLSGGRSENSSQFFKFTGGFTAAMPVVSIEGVSWAASSSPATYAVQDNASNPISITNSRFTSASNAVQFSFGGTGGYPQSVTLTSVGVSNPKFAANLQTIYNNSAVVLTSSGDYYVDPSSLQVTAGSGMTFTGGTYGSPAATSSVNNSATPLGFTQHYWNGTANTSDTWSFTPTISSTGYTPSSVLNIGHSGASTAYIQLNTLTYFAGGNAWVDGSGNVKSVNSFATTSNSGQFAMPNWIMYQGGSSNTWYLRDTTNGVMQLVCTAGSGTSGYCSTAGAFKPYALQVGSSQQTQWDANGVKHEGGTAPTTSAGTLTGTNAGGYISGLSAVSSVTITFANGGWTTWASCTANATMTGGQPYVSSTPGLKTSVTFAFPASYTGAITYSCIGN